MAKFDGQNFVVGGVAGTLNDLAWVKWHQANIKLGGLAMIAQPFVGGDVATITIGLKNGKSISERVRGPQKVAVLRRLAEAGSLMTAHSDLARIQGGETLDYGPISLSRAGLGTKKKGTLPWDEIDGYRLHQGTLMFDHDGVLSVSVPFARIENAFAALHLLDALAPGKDYDRMPPEMVPHGSIMRPTAAGHDPRYLSGRGRLLTLAIPIALVGLYLLAATPFVFMHQSNLAAARENNRRVLATARKQLPDSPNRTFQVACAGKGIDLSTGKLAGLSVLIGERNDHFIEVRPDAVYGNRASGRWSPDLTSSFSHVIENFPPDWNRSTKSVYPHRDWSGLKHIVAARELEWRTEKDYGKNIAGTTALAVRILSADGGTVVCEGTIEAAVKRRSYGDAHADGVASAVLGALCPGSKSPQCESALEDVTLLDPTSTARATR